MRHFVLLIDGKLPALGQQYAVTDRIRGLFGIFIFAFLLHCHLNLLISGVWHCAEICDSSVESLIMANTLIIMTMLM